jgi:hypothetical protein
MRKQNKDMLRSYMKANDMGNKCRDLCAADEVIKLFNDEWRKHFCWYTHDSILEDNGETIGELHQWLEMVKEHTSLLVDVHWDTLKELTKAEALLVFVKEVRGQDMRKLIDAVEDHSDQHITEETVSSLVDVQRFLQQILDLESPHEKFNSFVTQVGRDNRLAHKVNNCTTHVNGLRRIYNNIANREEATKAIIRHAVVNGQYNFEGNQVTMSSPESKKSHSLADLKDLRSRALLIVNSKSSRAVVYNTVQDEHTEDLQAQMNLFIAQVELVQSISDTLRELHELGHFQYLKIELCVEKTWVLISALSLSFMLKFAANFPCELT